MGFCALSQPGPLQQRHSWIREPRVVGGQEMTFGRSLQRHLGHFGHPTVLPGRVHLAQDSAEWRKPVTEPPFAIGKPFARQARGDTRVSPDKRRLVARSAAELAEQRAVFDATNNNGGARVLHWRPCKRRPVTRTQVPSSTRVVPGAK